MKKMSTNFKKATFLVFAGLTLTLSSCYNLGRHKICDTYVKDSGINNLDIHPELSNGESTDANN